MESEVRDEDEAGDDAALDDEGLPFDPDLYSINYWILHGEAED